MDRDLPIVSQIRKTLEEMTNPWREQWTRAKRWIFHSLEIALFFNLKRWAESIQPYRILILVVPAVFFVQILFNHLPLTAYRLPLTTPLLC